MKYVKIIAFWLTIVGALNWGLVALFNVNLVITLLADSALVNIVYLLIAASALYVAVMYWGKKLK